MHKMIKTLLLGIALVALALPELVGCGSSCGASVPEVTDRPWSERPRLDSVPASAVTQLGDGINAFAVDLQHQLGSRPGNLTFSPASIAVALGMTHAGARGETARELAQVLHLALPPEQLSPTFGALLGHWTTPRDPLANAPPDVLSDPVRQRNYFFELSVADRVFGQTGLPVDQTFQQLTGRFFGAPYQPIDFERAPEAARSRINDWVSRRTQQKIVELIPPNGVTSKTRFALVNAMYFRAGWRYPFEDNATRDDTFLADGVRRVTVKMMANDPPAGFVHQQADGVKLLELEYIESDFSLIVLLPDRVDGLPELETRLTSASLMRWLVGIRPYPEVMVRLPKFRLPPQGSVSLQQPLIALGLRSLFQEGRCDLTGIAQTTPRLVVGDIFHQCFVAINEDGTEAAAATAVMPLAGAAQRPPPPQFIVDHPFLFLIRDRRSGAILFMGRVTDPS